MLKKKDYKIIIEALIDDKLNPLAQQIINHEVELLRQQINTLEAKQAMLADQLAKTNTAINTLIRKLKNLNEI